MTGAGRAGRFSPAFVRATSRPATIRPGTAGDVVLKLDYEYYMREALREAKAAAETGEVPAGAVVVSPEDGLIISRGRNQVISLCDPTAHAEMTALRAAAIVLGNYRLTGLLLFSTLEPCPMCLTAAIHARVAAIHYGAREPKWGAAGSLINLLEQSGLNHYPAIAGGLLAAESSRLLKDFFWQRRNPGPC